MNTLTRDRAHQLMVDVATAMPFPVETADLGGGFTLQIDLGVHSDMSADPNDDLPHDRAGIDHAGLAEKYGMEDQAPVWWFETWAGGTDRQAFSTLGPDADLRDVTAWIAEQARAAGSPAAAATDALEPTTAPRRPTGDPAARERFMRERAERAAPSMREAKDALLEAFAGGPYEVWDGWHMYDVTDIFRAGPMDGAQAYKVRTDTTYGGASMSGPELAAFFPHRTEPMLTVEFLTPRKEQPGARPRLRTRHFKTGKGAAKAIEKHLARLVETGMQAEAGRP